MQECTRKNEIELIKKAVYGNGRAGLVEQTAQISTKVDRIEKTINSIEQDLKVLLEYKIGQKTQQLSVSDYKKERKWFITTAIAIIAILAAIFFTSCKTPAPIIITETEYSESIPDTIYVTLPSDTITVTDTLRITETGEVIIKPIQAFTDYAGAEAGIKDNELYLRIWNITEPFIYPTQSRIIYRTKTKQLPPIEIPYIPWWIIAIIISLFLLLILTKLRIL